MKQFLRQGLSGLQEKFIGNPVDNPNFIHVARKEIKKSKKEATFDFFFTLGNKRFQDTYYEIREESGKKKIFKRDYFYEIPASDIQQLWKSGLEEFDINNETKLKINVVSSILSNPNISQKEMIDVILQQMDQNQTNQNQLVKFLKQLAKFTSIGLYSAQEVVKQTFKIANNALIKKGMQHFAVIGGRQMMKEGTFITLKVLGKKVTSGTVVEVTKQAGKRKALTIATKSFSSGGFLSGLGVGIALNIGVGYAKSIINSKWSSNEESEIMEVDQKFCIEELKKFEKDYLNDEKNSKQLLKEIEENVSEISTQDTESIGDQDQLNGFFVDDRYLKRIIELNKDNKGEDKLNSSIDESESQELLQLDNCLKREVQEKLLGNAIKTNQQPEDLVLNVSQDQPQQKVGFLNSLKSIFCQQRKEKKK